MRRFLILFAAVFCCGLQFPAWQCFAQVGPIGQVSGHPPIQPANGGGGSPSFTAVNAAAKTGCGGGFTCSDTVIVGAGFAVVAFQASGTTTAVTLCGVSLFEVVNTGATNDTGMWTGTVPGCSSANDLSVTTNSGFGNMAYAVGLITGLSGSYSSGTPSDHNCVGNYPGTQSAPYPCTSSLTVNASGIAVGIGLAGSDFGSGVTACSPGSCDIKVTPASGGYASGIWHWTTSGQTPNFTASNNVNAGMLAASWH
jgi:hypothetical protein